MRGTGERSGLEPAEENESSEKMDEEDKVAGKVCLLTVRGTARGAMERAANSGMGEPSCRMRVRRDQCIVKARLAVIRDSNVFTDEPAGVVGLVIGSGAVSGLNCWVWGTKM